MAVDKHGHGVVDQNGYGYSSPTGNKMYTTLDSAGRVVGSKAGITVNPRDLGVIYKKPEGETSVTPTVPPTVVIPPEPTSGEETKTEETV